MCYTRVKQYGFMTYTSEDGRIVIREATRRRRTQKVFGRGGRTVTEKVWNVFVDGKLISQGVQLLKDAKRVGERRIALQTKNPWESTSGGCLVGPFAEGKKYPCDDDLRETETGEVVNIKTTVEGHFNLPTRFGGTVETLKEAEKFPGVKKGSVRQVKEPNPSSNPGSNLSKLATDLVPGDYVETSKGRLKVRRATSMKRGMLRVVFEKSNEILILPADSWVEIVSKKVLSKRKKNPCKVTNVGALVRKALRD